jgi:hypothetical protein
MEDFGTYLASENVSVLRMDWEEACVNAWTMRVLSLPALSDIFPTPLSLLVQDSGRECCRIFSQYLFLLARSLPMYLPSKLSAINMRINNR